MVTIGLKIIASRINEEVISDLERKQQMDKVN
jgi:hypothetical protein